MKLNRLTPIGLDVGTRWIKAVQLRRDRDGYAVAATARVQRTAESDALEGDEARRIAGVLMRQGFSGCEVALTVPGSKLHKSVMELPSRDSGAPLEQLARVELARGAKCDPAQMESAVWALPGGGRAGEGTHMMGVACTRADALAMIDGAESAGLRVIALDTQATAQARACAMAPAKAGAGPLWGALSMIVDLGWSRTDIALFVGDVLVYERSLDSAGLEHAHCEITRRLGIEDEVAAWLVEHGGMSAPTGAHDADKERLLSEAVELVEDYARSIAGEVTTSQAYGGRRFGNGLTPRVLLLGGAVRVPGLVELLDGAVQGGVTPVRLSDLAPGSIEHGDNYSFASAAGLALHGTARAVKGEAA